MSQTTGRSCPKCGSDNYMFRSRKQIEATPEQEAMLETKQRCKSCQHEWKDLASGVLQNRAAPE